jgi:hypothetical protein
MSRVLFFFFFLKIFFVTIIFQSNFEGKGEEKTKHNKIQSWKEKFGKKKDENAYCQLINLSYCLSLA